MQITNTTTPINYNTKALFLPVKRFEQQPQNTFVKTQEIVPSFRGTEKNILESIDKGTLEKLIATVTTGVVTSILALNTINKEKEKPNNDELILRIDNLEKTVEEYKEENKSLKDKINELIEFIKKEFSKPKEITSKKDNKIKNKDSIIIEFPKKHGRLSGIQEELKSFILKTPVPKESAQRLTQICGYLIYQKDKNDIITNLIEELSNPENDTQKIIEDFYTEIFDTNQDSDLQIDTNTKNATKQETSSENNNKQDLNTKLSLQGKELFVSQQNNNIAQPKVIGKIDLNMVGQKKSNKFSLLEHPNLPDHYIYSIGNTTVISSDLPTHFNKIVSNFNKEYSKKYYDENKEKIICAQKGLKMPKKVSVHDIKKEIEKLQKENSNNYVKITTVALGKSDTKRNANLSERYKTIAEIINNDKRFEKWFTLHAALRLIDRFVDFNSNVSMKEQCKEIVDTIEKTFIIMIKKGLLIVPHISEEQTNDNNESHNSLYYGPNINISLDNFDESEHEIREQFKKIFGTNTLTLGFGKKIYPFNEVGPSFTEGIINTIYNM